ncbi:hypothetical protein [Parasphingorhabdus pacifica]
MLVMAARRFIDRPAGEADPHLVMATFRRSSVYLLPDAAPLRLEDGGVWLPVFSTPAQLVAFCEASGVGIGGDGSVDWVSLPGERLLEHYLPAGCGVVLDVLAQHMLTIPGVSVEGEDGADA